MKTIALFMILSSLSVCAGTWRDDFNDGNLDGWDIQLAVGEIEGGDGEVGQIEIKDGEVVIINADTDIPSFMFFNDNQHVRDFELSVDWLFVRELSNKTWDYMGVMVRASDLSTTWVTFEARGNILFLIISPPPALDGFGRRDVPFPLELGKWYHIQIELKGSVLSLTADNEIISEIDWSAQPMLSKEGAVGIGAGGAEIHFDNFAITGDDVADNLSVTLHGKLATSWAKIKALSNTR